MKSVTVQLPDDVFQRAERLAAQRGATLSGEIAALVHRFSEEGEEKLESEGVALGAGLELA